mgnify:CR=1 FL=1
MDAAGLGGGGPEGGYGLWLDSQLASGSSEPCATFGNQSALLSSTRLRHDGISRLVETTDMQTTIGIDLQAQSVIYGQNRCKYICEWNAGNAELNKLFVGPYSRHVINYEHRFAKSKHDRWTEYMQIHVRMEC